MATKKIKVRDIFVKLNYVFPKDLYIINSYYVIGGDETETVNHTYNMCALESNISDILHTLFDKEENGDSIIFIPDIREFKDDFTKYTLITDKKKKSEIINKLGHINDICLDVTEWDSITKLIDNADINDMYKNNVSATMKLNSYKIHIVKKLFPIVTQKTINELYVGIPHTYVGEDYGRIVVQYNFSMFQMNLIFSFLPTT